MGATLQLDRISTLLALTAAACSPGSSGRTTTTTVGGTATATTLPTGGGSTMGDTSTTSSGGSSSSTGGPPPDVAVDTCGDGTVQPGETCDDGNGDSDDGCSSECQVECGYLCLTPGQACIPGFHGVQCDSPGAPFGQASPVANTCRIAELSLDGSHLVLSPPTALNGASTHLDAMFTDGNNDLFGFAGDTEDLASGSRLVAVDPASGVLTPIGPSLGVWVMGAGMNDLGELWVTVFDTYESNQDTEVQLARVNPNTGTFIEGPTTITMMGQPLSVYSTHVSDVAFRSDGTMFLSANAPGAPPPEPVSRYLEVDPGTATVQSMVEGPDDLYAAGIVFVGDQDEILAMDIRGEDDIYVLDLAAPPTLSATLLYPDPIPTNSGTADLAGCSTLPPVP